MREIVTETTLDRAEAGDKCVIVRTADDVVRLSETGLIPGETVEVLRRRKSASVVRIRGMRVALGSEVTSRITVRLRRHG